MPAPTVTSVNTPIGPTVGGVSVTITGTNFTGTTGVTIGGVAATSVSVVSDTSLTCTIPAGAAGGASVLVTNASGTNAGNSLFFYVVAVPTDTYIYLKGGRGDGFVPGWTGAITEEGEVDANGAVVGTAGKEVSEPYRDDFQVGDSIPINGSSITFRSALTFANPVLAPGPVIAATYGSATPDPISHTKPRQYYKVFTWLVFTSSNGLAYKFRKADVIGIGGMPRT